ncbi:unknown [Clostridium sp. CAG:967]|nr:unknown [Clostridium sp. CAG:967]
MSDELQQTMFSISQKAYEAVQKEEQSTASSDNASSTDDKKEGGDDDVIDAEYTKE